MTTRRSWGSARQPPSSSVYAGYGDLELRTRSVESFVAKLKPRDVLAVGAKQLHQQIGLLHIAFRRARTEPGHPMTEDEVIGAERLPRSVVTRNGGRTPAHVRHGRREG